MDILYLFITNIFLIGFLFFKEHQHKKVIRDILSARLSRDVSDFQYATKEESAESYEPPAEEVPLEDVEVDELMKSNK